MKHILNNIAQGTELPWVTLDSEGIHYSEIFEEDLDYVDLGLPSGILWAKCNVGATTETEYGKYFQWGDTVGYYDGEGAAEHSTWNTCPWGGDIPSMTTLDNEHDAAYVASNGVSRMPTATEFQELYDNTISTLFASGNTEFNGVAGRKFTSKTDSSKYIFIPASGNFVNGSLYYGGSHSFCWSSSLYSSNPNYAYCLFFGNGNISPLYYYLRYYGFCVRGVVSKN